MPKFKDGYDFLERDPFNPGNQVAGRVSFHRDERYGALTLSQVNGEPVDYPTIYGTPKLKYPFGPSRNYHFPSATKIVAFRKVDGTNIFAYRYRDSRGNTYISYKVRLFPYLRNPFLPMWQEVLERYPDIPKLFQRNPGISGFGFEMYGADNPHLIQYEAKLEPMLLFGIKGEGEVVLPNTIVAGNVPQAPIVATIEQDYVWHYQEEQRKLDENLKCIDAQEMLYTGEEGQVWYLQNKQTGLWQMFKCKPHQIEQIHWANSPLSSEVIHATALNALEVTDKVTVDIVTEYLREEFPEHQIQRSHARIEKAVDAVNEVADRRLKVRTLIERHDFPTDTDVPTILRAIHHEFPKSEMKKVYQAVVAVQRFR